MNEVYMTSDEFRLVRFHDVQEKTYAVAIEELRLGKKRSHWIWYVFPQLKGLGLSTTSEFYGLAGLAEARAYLEDTVLCYRLKEAIQAVLNQDSSAVAVLGELDALKFRSCLTLFSKADPSERLFSRALEHLFDGKSDTYTIELLKIRSEI